MSMLSNSYALNDKDIDSDTYLNDICEIVDYLQANLNPIIHEPKRLSILLILTKHSNLTFTLLQKMVNTSSGNLTNHLKHLSKHKLIKISRTFVQSRARTLISITPLGVEKLHEYFSLFQYTFDKFDL